MLETGSLELSAVDGEVRLRATSDGPAATVALPPGDCEILASYTHDGSVLALSVGDDSDRVTGAAPTILGLYTSDPASVTGVDITTQETGLAPSWAGGRSGWSPWSPCSPGRRCCGFRARGRGPSCRGSPRWTASSPPACWPSPSSRLP